jgi:hypothetical protein
MRQSWKGLVVGGLTGFAAGVVLDLGASGATQAARASKRGAELGRRAARAGRRAAPNLPPRAHSVRERAAVKKPS